MTTSWPLNFGTNFYKNFDTSIQGYIVQKCFEQLNSFKDQPNALQMKSLILIGNEFFVYKKTLLSFLDFMIGQKFTETSHNKEFYVQICILILKCILGYSYSKRVTLRTLILLNNIISISIVNSFLVNQEFFQGILKIMVDQFEHFSKQK